MSKDRAITHNFEDEQLESVFVGRRDAQARPTVILIPTVMGVSDLEIGFGRQLVELGYNAFVADLFGKKFRGETRDTMFGELNRLKADRAALRRRMLHVLGLCQGLDEVSQKRIVATEDARQHAFGKLAGYSDPVAALIDSKFAALVERDGRTGRVSWPVRPGRPRTGGDQGQGGRLPRLG